MKQRVRHLLSVLLVCAMVLSLLPISVLAEELETPLTTVTEPAEAPKVEGEPGGEPAPEPEPEPDPKPAQTIYVSSEGNDVNDGSNENPYATLAKAVEQAEDGAVIYVMTNLTVNTLARVTDKHVTVTSVNPDNPVTLTRGSVQGADNNQSHYNSAMIEVTTFASEDSDNASSVTLTDIILDDAGKHDGTYFAQTNMEIKENTGGNLGFVQDSMVTAHGKGNRAVNIILGDGAVLKNYGGMSAVYGTMNAHITMLPGSKITAPDVTDRVKSSSTKPPKNETGPAGAVWLQGAEFIMNDGAEISDMVGRAVYADSGTATINGTISDISSDADMWQGKGGVAVHVRNNADVTFGSTALFDNSNVSTKIDSAVFVNQGSFEMVNGSKICNLAGTAVQGYGSKTQPAGSINITIDGEICGIIDGGNAINLNESGGLYCKIGPNADIHHNTVWAATLYAQGPGIVIDLYGTIRDNTSTQYSAGIWLANNFNGAKLTMYGNAKITGNTSVNKGAAVIVSEGTFTMNGGIISGNYSHTKSLAGGVSVRRNGTFIMNGGEITGNTTTGYGGGIRYNDDSRENEYVILNGGTISGNIANADAVLNEESGKYEFSGGVSNDISVATHKFGFIDRYVTIGDEMVIGNENIYFEKYGFTLDNPGSDVKFGNASTDCETAVTIALAGQYLTGVKGSLWYQTSHDNFPMTVNGLTYDNTKDLYAAVIETKADGTPVDNAAVKLQVVEPDEDGSCHLVLPGNANGYAVVFLQEKDDRARIVKVTPADITVYTGGESYSGAVSGTSGSTEGLPEPGFYITLSDALEEDLEKLASYTGEGPMDLSGWISFEASTSSGGPRSWTLERYDEDGESTVTIDGKERYIYRLVAPEGQDAVRVQFTNENGQAIPSDKFVIDLDTLYQEFDMSIYTNTVDAGSVVAKVKDKTDQYTVSTSSGVLTVRGVVNTETGTTDIVDKVPSTAENVTAVAAEGTKYLINNSNLEVNDSTGVKLLADNIVEEGKQALTQYLLDGDYGLNNEFKFEYRYLDLVDSSNGNVWIRPSQPMTIFWPYPEGADSNDTFYVIHFDGLDRNYDDLSNALKNNQPENCKITRTSGGITFTVDSFSPFALVWKEGSSSGGGTGTRDDYTLHYVTNGGNHLSSETKSSSWTKDYEDLPIPVRDGYTFEGWYWDLRLTEPVTGDVKVNKTTVTLYAKWSGGSYGPDDTGVSGWLETDKHNAFLSGYPDGSFQADKNMTRAEVAQMFYALLLDKNVTITKSFSDVPTDAWYAKAVNTLSSLGMLGGYPDGTFRPDAPITRAEFAAIALAFAYDPASASCSYTDVSTSAWYYTYVAQATTYGWIGGYPDGSFRPNNSITRAEVAVIVNNMLGRDADESYINRNADELVSFVDLSKNHWAYYTIMESTNSHDYTASSNGESWKA